MKIKIDYREKQLIENINFILESQTSLQKTIEYEIVNLEIGDISIFTDDNNEILIIERKTINDLASSIIDSRFKEQSVRLHHCNIPNHNIIYLIEGNMSDLNIKYTRIREPALYSAMIVLQYHKGFSVFRTFNIKESANFILRISDKIQREKKNGFYSITNINQNNSFTLDISQNNNIKESCNHEIDLDPTSALCVKRKKASNITPTNIGEIMLSQIPGISFKTASSILSNFTSFSQFMTELNEDNKCLEKITIESVNGKTRKLSSTIRNNIINYLYCNEKSIIKID